MGDRCRQLPLYVNVLTKLSFPGGYFIAPVMTDSVSFLCRFYDKTLNQWEDRESFVKHPGKYDLLSMDYEAKVWLHEQGTHFDL